LSRLISCRLVWLVGMDISDERAGHLFMVELSIYFSPEDRGSSSPWNVSSILPDYTMSTQADSSPHCKGHEHLKSQWT